MDKIIITGTQGFIGSNLKQKLQDKYEIIEINEDVFKTVNWREFVSKYFWLDIKSVFHVGACSDTLETDVNYMMLLNYEFTKHLSILCKTKNIPLIYSSSAANYGTNNEHPSNLYGWSKYVAEDYVISNGGIGLRYFNVYGPGEEHKGKMSSVAYQMFLKSKNNEEIKLFPKKPTRDFVYIDDVVDANIFAYTNYENLKGSFYDVGSSQSRSFEDVLTNMNLSFNYYDLNQIPNGYQFYTKSNKKRWMKGWEPKFSLEDGINSYLNYLNNNG
jgi:ADP-L-glycero-D-manno-heptose 6-epimerase